MAAFTRAFCAAILLGCFAASVNAADGPLTASVSTAGNVSLSAGGRPVLSAVLGAHDGGWQGLGITGTASGDLTPGVPRPFALKVKGQPVLSGTATISQKGGGLRAEYAFTPEQDVTLNSLHVGFDATAQAWAGGAWKADGKSGSFPAEFKDTSLFFGAIKTLVVAPPDGPDWSLVFDAPTPVLIQDNRKWSASFTVRVMPPHTGNAFKKGETSRIGLLLTASVPLEVEFDGPTTLVAGPDWVPLKLDLEIAAGTALDFSTQGFHDAPAGKNGRVIARTDGQFVFEKDPQTARRFYGINLCFGAQFLSHEQSDLLADRLVRLGYNAVRIHHYEGDLCQGQPNTYTFNPEKLDQFDYLCAALGKRGIYLTTDLFVSRPMSFKEIGFETTEKFSDYPFKVLVAVHEGAFANWKAFTTALLGHTNPYTKRRYADDPALAWISLINEGNFGNYYNTIQKIPEWKKAWNAWLAETRTDRAGLAKAWGAALKEGEDPANGSVGLPGSLNEDGPRCRDFVAFIAVMEKRMALRMTKVIREELGCKALITNMNAWTNHLSTQAARTVLDYVDDHFYIDHPEFLEKDWQLPSRSKNTSPIAGGAAGGRTAVFTRLFGKPFTITEYNYSGPGRFRGVGGILTGAMGALQGWGGIWRFAYSHSPKSIVEPAPINYFDMATDPLSQAAERASLCLYLRGDMAMAPHSVAVVTTEKDAFPEKKIPGLAPGWHWLGWVTRLGMEVVPETGAALTETAVLPVADGTRAAVEKAGPAVLDLNPYKMDEAKLLAVLREKGILGAGNPTDPSKAVFRSETGEITIDAPKDTLTLDTPRTAGGYAPAGQTIVSADGTVSLSIQGADATAWVSSLDGAPIASSGRLLLTHLTDLQNTEIKYGEKARQTLLAWGKLPHLVRVGKVAVRLKLKESASLKVYALATSGKRIAEVSATVTNGALEFTADVSANPAEGARLLYEITK